MIDYLSQHHNSLHNFIGICTIYESLTLTDFTRPRLCEMPDFLRKFRSEDNKALLTRRESGYLNVCATIPERLSPSSRLFNGLHKSSSVHIARDFETNYLTISVGDRPTSVRRDNFNGAIYLTNFIRPHLYTLPTNQILSA